MPSCFICGRSKTAKSKSENISFHKFPSKECILQKWHGFILSHNLSVDKINKSSLICSIHFVPESFIVHNENRLLHKHALPTIQISKVKGENTVYPELKEILSLPEYESSTSKLQMKNILVKTNFSYEPPESIALTSISDTSELPKGFLPLANLDQTTASTSSKTFRVYTPTIKKKFKSSFLAVASVSSNDTPRKSYLKYGVHKLSNETEIKNKKIKGLQQFIRRKNKQIASMSEIINKLKSNNL